MTYNIFYKEKTKYVEVKYMQTTENLEEEIFKWKI